MPDRRKTTTERGLGSRWRKLCNEARQVYGNDCHLCGLPIAGREWTLDHLDPRATHGTRVPPLSRVRPAHRSCNSSRGARPIQQQVSRRTENW